MAQIARIFTVAAFLASSVAGCGDDTGGSGGSGGSGSGGGSTTGATTGATTTGATTTGATTTGATTSGATTSGATSTSTGATCEQLGTGTPAELGDAWDAYCVAATALAEEVCGAANVDDCLGLRDLILQGGEGCEAELTASLDCITAAVPTIDPGDCTCTDGSPTCPDLDPSLCAAEEAAGDACEACVDQ